jgi:uncharacterized repeat protein (TIGR03806 family)
VKIASFGEDREGEIYFVDNSLGTIHRLTKNDAVDHGAKFPRKLSETGLFASVKNQALAPGVVPFSINAEMWSDGATANRYIALPGHATASLDEHDKSFPANGVLVKTLSLPLAQSGVVAEQPIETQVLHFDGRNWLGYSYAWNPEGTDAQLVAAEGAERKLNVADTSAQGGVRQQTWRFASRAECMRCHNLWSGYRLAFRTGQLNRDHQYGKAADNQLRTLAHIGLVKWTNRDDKDQNQQADNKAAIAAPPPHASHARLPNPLDKTLPLEARARAYLHANCAHCHRYGGGGTASINLDFDTPLANTGALDRLPTQGAFALDDARIIAPSEPHRSVLLYRMAKLGGGRMPHIGSRVVDQNGLRLVRDWIGSLAPADAAQSEERRLVNQKCAHDIRADRFELVLSTTSGAMALIAAIDDNRVTGRARTRAIMAANSHSDSQIRDLFERFIPEEQRAERLGSNIAAEAILALAGDVQRGKQLFFEHAALNCKTCHRIDGSGGQAGPDLSEIGKKYQPAQLLASILAPSKEIDEKYRTYLVATDEGKLHIGLLVRRTADQIVLRDANDKLIELRAAEVESISPQRVSLMPEGQLADLTAQQAADLLAFLSSRK